MPLFSRKPSRETTFTSCSEVLERYYDLLNSWAMILARDDQARARDLVHDLWVHLTLTQPDLSEVTNLDGYLYRCLRHLYLSQIAKTSRDALQCVNAVDFDSLQIALWANPRIDTLDVQNDLRRIANYVSWRKDFAKSPSYFILRFLHGYYLHEVADLAGLPLSSIHPKMTQIRAELRAHLGDPKKLKLVDRETPPSPELSWQVMSSPALFAELRNKLLTAKRSDCLSRERLLAYYESGTKEPLDCATLAHVVSCERCLDIIDKRLGRPNLRDREPLDGIHPSSSRGDGGGTGHGGVDSLLRVVRRRSEDTYQHHPEELFIAVNGKIIASHDVHSSGNKLSARVERSESAEFVEVFSEQGLRLAFLSIQELPPEGPHEQTQLVKLSDNRHLELMLSYDGLGICVEVVYEIPYLSLAVTEIAESRTHQLTTERRMPWRLPLPAFTTHWRRFGLALSGACLLVAGIAATVHFTSRKKPEVTSTARIREFKQGLHTSAILAPGLTEHRVVAYQKTALDGRSLQRGTAEVWRDADSRRWSRHLYDSEHHMLAAEWKGKSGAAKTYKSDRGISEDDVWKEEISSEVLSSVPDQELRVKPTGDGYSVELSASASRPNIKSAVLLLDANLHPVEENLRIETDAESYDLKFVQTTYERRRTSTISDRMFQMEPVDRSPSSGLAVELRPGASQIELAETYIAVLYQLKEFATDRAEPIEVVRAANEVRVTGRVSSDLQKIYMTTRLKAMPSHELLNIDLESPSDRRRHAGEGAQQVHTDVQIYDMSEGRIFMDTSLRKYFVSHGMPAHELDASVARFSRDTIARAQKSLQDAFALQELCKGVSAQELPQVSDLSKRQWTQLLLRRVTALNDDLTALDDQLRPLSPMGAAAVKEPPVLIMDRAGLLLESDRLLKEMQVLNRTVGDAFAYTLRPTLAATPEMLMSTIVSEIPTSRAQAMAALAQQLNASTRTNSGSSLPGSVQQQP